MTSKNVQLSGRLGDEQLDLPGDDGDGDEPDEAA